MARHQARKGPTLPRSLLGQTSAKGRSQAPKRRDTKGKGRLVPIGDVYNYEPEKNRRGNVSLTLDEDERRGAGYGSDDADDSNGESSSKREPRLIGLGEDDDMLESEDDDEIDSDGAFGESDEEKFAGFIFRKKVRHDILS